MNELISLVERLVAIDSVNPDLVPGGAGEGEIAEFVATWLEYAGLDVSVEEVSPGRPNVVGVARGTGGGCSLMLNAHTDTVGVSGMRCPHKPHIKGRRLYGRGAYDMKGSLAAVMIVAARAAEQRMRGDLIVTAVVDEECGSAGTEAIVEHYSADAAIVTEPSGLNVCIAHKGFVWLKIETTGRAAHGSRADLGIDAITRMAPLLSGLERLGRTLGESPSHPLLGGGSIHSSMIKGGQELSTYPERCLLHVERRTVPGEAVELVESQIREIAAGATVETMFAREPFEVGENERIVKILRRQAHAASGRKPKLVGNPGWMDSAILASARIPTVIFGPGGGGAHALVEWVDLKQVQCCADVLFATAEEFCR